MVIGEAKVALQAFMLLFGTEGSAAHEDVACLAANIWFEARGSSFADKLAVGQVVMNRVADESHAGDVCAVVFEPHQFSWTAENGDDAIVLNNEIDRNAWTDTSIAALLAWRATAPDLTAGATHFHAVGLRPEWSEAMMQRAAYGGHLFYVDQAIIPMPAPDRTESLHPARRQIDASTVAAAETNLAGFWQRAGLAEPGVPFMPVDLDGTATD